VTYTVYGRLLVQFLLSTGDACLQRKRSGNFGMKNSENCEIWPQETRNIPLSYGSEVCFENLNLLRVNHEMRSDRRTYILIAHAALSYVGRQKNVHSSYNNTVYINTLVDTVKVNYISTLGLLQLALYFCYLSMQLF